MQDLPSADRPTLYSIQANFLTGIYAMGLGLLSPAFMLFAQSFVPSHRRLARNRRVGLHYFFGGIG
jgi:hypothetical protein